jgi:hypothetical protein
VLRVMLHTRWSAEAWSQVRVEFKKALAPQRDPARGLAQLSTLDAAISTAASTATGSE